MSDDATTQSIREAVAKDYADRLVNDDELRMQVAEANFKDFTYEELVVCACFAFDEETLTSLGIFATGHAGDPVVQSIDGCTLTLMSGGWPTGTEVWVVCYGDQRLGRVIFDGPHSTAWIDLENMDYPKFCHYLSGGDFSPTSSLEDQRKSVLGEAVGLLKHAIAI